jgi:hypothetical protein
MTLAGSAVLGAASAVPSKRALTLNPTRTLTWTWWSEIASSQTSRHRALWCQPAIE